MNHKEYIIPIGEEAKEYDEMFIGVIRKQPELIRCKDCRYYYPAEYDKKGNTCLMLREMINAPIWVKEDDYCSKGVKE